MNVLQMLGKGPLVVMAGYSPYRGGLGKGGGVGYWVVWDVRVTML